MAYGALRGMFEVLARMNGFNAGRHEMTCTFEELLQAAMHACGCWNDSCEAREQMRLEILEVKPEHRKELLEMFREDYG